MLVRKWIERVSKTIEHYIRKLSSGLSRSDDTVEGQSKAFRVWMFCSTAAILMMLLIAYSPVQNSEARQELRSEILPSLVDQVPDGFVLVPIEPLNFETIDALIENHAYIDLYHSTDEHGYQGDQSGTKQRKRLIARGLPLLRAPKNPSKFAVIVKESDSDILAKLGVPVLVVVRKGPPKGGYPAVRRSQRNPKAKKLKADFIVEEIPEAETFVSN